jgi:AraC family transcriptional regulator
MAWSGPRQLLADPELKMLAVYHDSPDITDESKLRSDACITVPEGTDVDGEVLTRDVPGGLFAVGHFEIQPTEYGDAWDKLMGEYLPESGYVPDERLCYELYLNDPEQHPEGTHIVDICEPVRPLS